MRPKVLPILVAALLAATPLAAQTDLGDSVESQIVAQLREQGYGHIAVSRTFLGRVRVTAERADRHREIVANPLTGEILRDLLRTDRRYAGDERSSDTATTAVRGASGEKEADITEGVSIGVSNDTSLGDGAIGE